MAHTIPSPIIEACQFSLNRACTGNEAVKHDVLPAQTHEGVKNCANSVTFPYVLMCWMICYVVRKRRNVFAHI